MKHIYWLFLLFFVGATTQTLGQERGLFKKKPTITPNAQKKEKKNEFEELELETPKLQFQTQFQPVPQNEIPATPPPAAKLDELKNTPTNTVPPIQITPIMSEKRDTTKVLKEGELDVVEERIEMRVVDADSSAVEPEDDDVSEDWVKVAEYYSIWDSRTIDPYGLDPKDFDDVVDIHLYDPTKNQLWAMPLEKSVVTSNFGPRWGRLHAGVDLDLETGDPVNAAFDGMVRIVGWDGGGYGRFIVIRHYNGLETLYGHLSRQLVEDKQLVKAGDLIGLGGNTGRSYGSHLHYETRYEGNPFNAKQVYDFPENKILSEHFLITKETFSIAARVASEFEAGAKKVEYRKTSWVKIRSGDTLAEIAARHGTTAQKLAKINRISTRSTLRVGKKIRVK